MLLDFLSKQFFNGLCTKHRPLFVLNPFCGRNQYGYEDLQEDATSIWFAGKVLLSENKLKDHIGRHENSRVILKLTKAGQGAPSRELVS